MKPARLGSSVGISKVPAGSPARRRARLPHDDKVLVEEFQDGVGSSAACSEPRAVASVVGEIVAHADWYDYAAKYDEGGMELVVPARISEAAAERVGELAVASFVATDCEAWRASTSSSARTARSSSTS